MAIEWTDDLNTGVDAIDNQHKEIVDYINRLENAINQENRLAVGEVLDKLLEYTLSHFAFEESMQEEAKYEHAKQHKAIHEMFSKRVARYKERHAAGDDIAKELHSMLCTWLLHHIKRDDMAFVNDVNVNITGKKKGLFSLTAPNIRV
ncbi:MAG: bacteriohemerythrin [Gallionella sp.]|nr:bacteriohemerythrin [Gallionella sp.]